MQKSLGKLIVVATPIGNLNDFCPRAIETLKNSDLILVEDTRHFSKLVVKFEIKTPYISNHEHNEKQQVSKILNLLKEGNTISLITDAGTPCISDPGFRIVRACHLDNLLVSTVPGPCAAIAALSMSGLPSDEFSFRGFLPVKSGQKENLINKCLESEITSIFYESTHRILKTVELISRLAPERELFIVRELTKKFEEYYSGTSVEVYNKILNANSNKGEFVVILSKPSKIQRNSEE